MIRVIIESPFAGDVKKNQAYLKRCMMDSIARGEAPFSSHMMYTQVLNDLVLEDRQLGLAMCERWRLVADYTVVYTDLGISTGMQLGMLEAHKIGQRVIQRKLDS